MRTASSLTVSHWKSHCTPHGANHACPPREQPRIAPWIPCMPPQSNHTCPPGSNHACPPGATMHAPPGSNHAQPPGATTHAPQSNHACPPGATMHTPPEQPHMPPWEQPRMPPQEQPHMAPPEQPHMPPRSNHAVRNAPPGAHHAMPPPHCGQTDTCKNITFANFVCGR